MGVVSERGNMASSEKEELNATQGAEVKVPCSECSGKTCHKILLSLDQSGEERDGYWELYWDAHYQIIQCQGCKTVSFRKTTSNSEDYDQIGENKWEHVIYEDLYPSRIEGRKGINDGIIYLPNNIQRIYKETLQTLNARSPILAGIGLRALVETVCKEEEAAGNNLVKKIDDLVAKNILTPAGAEILHKIRTLGNDAAHEVRPHNDRQLGLAMDVVEHLLAAVYILPKQVEAEFGNEDS
jgi:Domain of unknown function (DUF4145)